MRYQHQINKVVIAVKVFLCCLPMVSKSLDPSVVASLRMAKTLFL